MCLLEFVQQIGSVACNCFIFVEIQTLSENK